MVPGCEISKSKNCTLRALFRVACGGSCWVGLSRSYDVLAPAASLSNSKHLVLVDISVFCAPGELWVAIRLDLAPTVLARACNVRIAARDFCTVPEWATAGGGAVLHPSGTSTSLYAGTVF